jgi:hypothetical protein
VTVNFIGAQFNYFVGVVGPHKIRVFAFSANALAGVEK